MGLFNIQILFLAFVTLLYSIELTSQALNFEPPPYPDLLPPSYVIENGIVRLTGHSVGGIAVVEDEYFLGAVVNGRFHPVDPNNRYAIVNTRTGRFVEVSANFKIRLLNRVTARAIYNDEQNSRRGGDAGASSSSHRPR